MKIRIDSRSFQHPGELRAVRHLAAASALIGLLLGAIPAAAAGWGGRDKSGPPALTAPLTSVTAAGSTSDPTDDTFEEGAVAIDITSFSATPAGDVIIFSFTFDNAISPADSPAANATGGLIDIDADQNPGTGEESNAEFFTGEPRPLGNEFYIDLFSYSSATGEADILFDGPGDNDFVVGSAQVTYSATSLTVRAPISIISGNVNTAAVLGTVDEPTDVVPNVGFVSSDTVDTVLQLQDGRFRVSVTWTDFFGNSGPGLVVPFQSNDSGLFWFFAPDNWEMLIKVLDGCGVTDHYWVFFAATTNVGFEVTVVDTQAGMTKTYTNPLGQPADAVTDTTAFATCP